MASTANVILKVLSGKETPYDIVYGFATSAFGDIFIGCISDMSNAICHLHFVHKYSKTYIQELQQRWPNSTLTENNILAQERVQHLFDAGLTNTEVTEVIAVNGTAFQVNVWNALLTIPVGETRTYSEVAEQLQKPKAVRAVANAVASNEIAFLIPCHRVVSKDGNLFKYRWGGDLKKHIMDFEKNLNKT